MEIVIKPPKNSFTINLPEIWRYRELFYIFAWRDIKVRYKQTVLGVLWVIFQPLTQMAIFTYFFGRVAQIPSGELPYFLFVLTGLVFWNYFSNTLSLASNSLVENENIIKKVYFPKLILPLSTTVTGFVDFCINISILLIITLISGFDFSPLLLLIIPLSVVIIAFSAAGLGLFLSSLNVKYRDVRYILPFFIQLLLFVTPVIYPTAIVSPVNKLILSLNPLTGIIEAMRSVISGSYTIDWLSICIGIISTTVIFFAGLFYFHRTEQFFADIV